MELNNNDKEYLEYYRTNYIVTCSKCGGEDAFCECWRKYNREIQKIIAQIPKSFRNLKFKDLTHPDTGKKLKQLMIDYAFNLRDHRFGGDKNCVYCYGSKGTGKTLGAILILMAAIKQGYKVYYFHSLKACEELIREEWSEKDNFNKPPFLTIMKDYDFVVIDTLGVEDVIVDPIARVIEAGINSRAVNMMPMFFVSSVLRGQLDKASVSYKIASAFKTQTVNWEFTGFDYTVAIEAALMSGGK